jgi:hypothetical protein
MGIIPRKIKKVKGFVKCKMGPLVYETDKDRIFLEKIGKVFDNAVEEGRIIMRPGRLPKRNDPTDEEIESHEMIMSHYFENVKETNKRIGNKPRFLSRILKKIGIIS